MPSLLLIGTGRAAFHLGHAFRAAGIDLKGVVGRDAMRTEELAIKLQVRAFSLDDKLPTTEVILLAVTDDAIAEVAARIPATEAVVSHTSGARSLDLLEMHAHRGVFWPIQTLSSNEPIELGKVPMIIDGNDDHSRNVLQALAGRISSRVTHLQHAERQHVHLAAVFTSNLPVFLVGEGQRLLKEAGLPTDLLGTLWRTTAEKVTEIGPEKALTGPARRGDVRTVEQHMELLAKDPELREAYGLLSKLIMKRFGHG